MAQTQFRLQSFSPGSIAAESPTRRNQLFLWIPAVQTNSTLMASCVLLPNFALVCFTALPTACPVF
jgi:hypothetical protein